MLKRALRASDNLKETLPAFLALVLLAMAVEKDVSNLACWWLIFRVAHGVCYLFKINYVRTLAWLGALGSLILNGLSDYCLTKKRGTIGPSIYLPQPFFIPQY